MPIYDILVKNGEKLGCNCACRLGAALVLVFAGWAYSFKLRYVSHCHCHDVTASRNLQMTRGQQKKHSSCKLQQVCMQHPFVPCFNRCRF